MALSNPFHAYLNNGASFKIIVSSFVIVLMRFLFIAVNKTISRKPSTPSYITLTCTWSGDLQGARIWTLLCLFIIVCIILFSNDIDLSIVFLSKEHYKNTDSAIKGEGFPPQQDISLYSPTLKITDFFYLHESKNNFILSLCIVIDFIKSGYSVKLPQNPFSQEIVFIFDHKGLEVNVNVYWDCNKWTITGLLSVNLQDFSVWVLLLTGYFRNRMAKLIFPCSTYVQEFLHCFKPGMGICFV